MSTSYTLFNTLTVSLTYWVILKTGQRVYCPDDILAFYYRFTLQKGRENGSKLITDEKILVVEKG